MCAASHAAVSLSATPASRRAVKANIEVLKTANIKVLSTPVRVGGQASFWGSASSVKTPALRFSRSR
jgi:hypothetical protein